MAALEGAPREYRAGKGSTGGGEGEQRREQQVAWSEGRSMYNVACASSSATAAHTDIHYNTRNTSLLEVDSSPRKPLSFLHSPHFVRRFYLLGAALIGMVDYRT